MYVDIIDWDSDSSSFSRAFSSSSSALSDTTGEVAAHVAGIAPAISQKPSRRCVTFSDRRTQEDEDDVEEIDDPSLVDGAPEWSRERDDFAAGVLGRETPAERKQQQVPVEKAVDAESARIPPPPPPAEKLAEPTKVKDTRAEPRQRVTAPHTQSLPSVPAAPQHRHSLPPAPRHGDPLHRDVVSSPPASYHPPSSSPSPLAPARGADTSKHEESHAGHRHLSNGSSPLSERRPVNEMAASEARAVCTHLSATLLATYHTVKRNTRARLFRRYYDKWLRLPTRTNVVNATTTAPCAGPIPAKPTSTRSTQTESDTNADVESYAGSHTLSPRMGSIGSDGEGREMLRCSDDMTHSSSRDGSAVERGERQREPSSSPPAAGVSQHPRPPFRYSPAPPLVEGIAARSRPAVHLSDVRKADLPRRKGHSPSRSGPSVGLPSVVPDPIRVYYRK